MEGWVTKPLGDIVVKTATIDPRKKPDESFFYVDVSSVSNKTLEITEATELMGKDAPSRARRAISSGDVIFATVRPTLRRIAIVPEYLDGEVCSTGYFVFQAKPELYNRYLYYFLQTEAFIARMEKLQAGASYPAVNDTQVRSELISYPEVIEQKRIVAILDEVFADIEQVRAKTEQNLKNARELFESYLDQVAGEKKPLGEFVSIKTGKLNANAAVEGGQFPFFTCSREIFAIDRFSFDCEAILLAGNNASGDFNVKHYKGKFDAYQRTYVITITDENKLLYPFLYYQMIKSLKELKEGSVGAGTKFLKIGMIQNLKISIPSLAEQKKILSTLLVLKEELDRLEEVYEEKLECLDELKQSILQKAFSGELTQKENQGAVA